MKPRLLEQVRATTRAKQYSYRIEEDEIREFSTDLASARNVWASSRTRDRATGARRPAGQIAVALTDR